MFFLAYLGDGYNYLEDNEYIVDNKEELSDQDKRIEEEKNNNLIPN